MRVRFQYPEESYQAICDLTEKKARRIFEELKTDLLCSWAELVGEDDEDYMEVLDSFDNEQRAAILHRTFGDMIKRKVVRA